MTVTRVGPVVDATPRVRRARLLLGAAVLAAGCQAVGDVLDRVGAQRPTARVVGASLEDLTLEGARVALDVEVSNPYAVALPIAALEGALSSGGVTFARASAEDVAALPARGKSTRALLVDVPFADLLSALEGVRPGAIVPYEAELSLAVDAPGLGRLALPVRTSGEVPVPAVPDVQLAALRWESLSLMSAEATLELDVTNPNAFGVDLDELGVDLVLGGTSVGRVALARPAGLGAGDRARLSIPLRVSPLALGAAAFEMFSGEGAGYALRGQLDVGTPFGRLAMPLDVDGQTVFTR